eukprot:6326277-Pyramimonas_sp.AAC.1
MGMSSSGAGAGSVCRISPRSADLSFGRMSAREKFWKVLPASSNLRGGKPEGRARELESTLI